MGIWYRIGAAAVTNGSPAVVGVGTLWTTQASLGDIFIGPDLVNYEITSITDDTHLTVKQLSGTGAYAGATASAQPYAIIRNFTSTLPAQLASQLAAMMTAWHVTTDELTAWLSGSGTVPVHDSVGNVYQVQTPAALGATLNGRISKSVAGAANVVLTTAEASNLFIELTGVLTGNIAVIVPASARGYYIYNGTSGAFSVTVKTPAGSGVAVDQGKRVVLACDATNVVNAFTAMPGLTAADLVNTPAGNIAATTVQAALNELDADQSLNVLQLAYGLAAALDAAAMANKRVTDVTSYLTQAGEATVTQAASTDYAHAYASVAVTLPKAYFDTAYQVVVECISATPFLGCEGSVQVQSRATNGFVLAITGSATSATLRWKTLHPNAK